MNKPFHDADTKIALNESGFIRPLRLGNSYYIDYYLLIAAIYLEFHRPEEEWTVEECIEWMSQDFSRIGRPSNWVRDFIDE